MLYIVGTPIGNLKDITLRALDVLREVDVIACEDTRHTLGLLNVYEIKKPLVSYHRHNEKERTPELLDMLREGKQIALVSDAGMPSISDPGAELVSECREEGLEVCVVPSGTAVTSAVALSGIKSHGFLFLGFTPAKSADKVAFLQKYKFLDVPLIFYVAPHDLESEAAAFLSVFGDRKVWLVKELTKVFESVVETSLAAFSVPNQKGEFVMIVEGACSENPLNALSIEEHIAHYISCGSTKPEAVKLVASDRGLPKSEVYKRAIDI